jgi:hypothetical protein
MTYLDTKPYIEYIRSHCCIVCGEPTVDADHLQTRGMGGRKKKGTVTNMDIDFSCIPLCREHHTERHSVGNTGIVSKYNINVWRDAFILLRAFMIREFYEKD